MTINAPDLITDLSDLIDAALAAGRHVCAVVEDDDGHGTTVAHTVEQHYCDIVICKWRSAGGSELPIKRTRGLSEITRLRIDGKLAWSVA